MYCTGAGAVHERLLLVGSLHFTVSDWENVYRPVDAEVRSNDKQISSASSLLRVSPEMSDFAGAYIGHRRFPDRRRPTTGDARCDRRPLLTVILSWGPLSSDTGDTGRPNRFVPSQSFPPCPSFAMSGRSSLLEFRKGMREDETRRKPHKFSEHQYRTIPSSLFALTRHCAR
jgi:hypothetical protein